MYYVKYVLVMMLTYLIVSSQYFVLNKHQVDVNNEPSNAWLKIIGLLLLCSIETYFSKSLKTSQQRMMTTSIQIKAYCIIIIYTGVIGGCSIYTILDVVFDYKKYMYCHVYHLINDVENENSIFS